MMQLQQDIKEEKIDVSDMNIISIGKAHMLEYSTTGKKVAKGKGGYKCGKMVVRKNHRLYVDNNVDVGRRRFYVQVLACAQTIVQIVVNIKKVLACNNTYIDLDNSTKLS